MFMTPWKSLTPWVLLLVEESYLLYINSGYTNLGHKTYTTILKNHMQATLDAIIGEKPISCYQKQQYDAHFPPIDI